MKLISEQKGVDNFHPSTWFITGSTGLVGSTIAELLTENEIQVIALVRNTSPVHMIEFLENLGVKLVYGDLLKVETYIKYLPTCDIVVHTAAAVNIRSKKKNWEINHKGTEILCEAMREVGVSRLIHISTAGIYGHSSIDGCGENSKPNPYGHYLKSKLAAERLLIDKFTDLSSTIIRPPFIYGEPNRDRHIYPAIMKIPGWLTPKVWRYNTKFGFVHAEDIARLVFLTGTKFTTPSLIYNIQSFSVSYTSLVKMINNTREMETRLVPIPFILIFLGGLILEGILLLTGRSYGIIQRLRILKNHWTFSTKRVSKELGFEAKHTDSNEFERLMYKFYRGIQNENEFINMKEFVEDEK